MKLTRLRINRLPGIERPFELGPRELAGTLHVVHGPNESGKTSLVRALRSVLWRELEPGEQIEVEAHFDAGDTQWYARREGSRVAWQRDGVDSPPPALPPVEIASSFLVTIEEVTRPENDDFAARIRSALAGGVDFEELARERKRPDGSTKAAENLRGARTRLRGVETGLQELDREALASSALESQLQELQALQADARVLDELLELVRVEDRLQGVRARLSAFPEGMHRLRGDEAVRKKELDTAAQAAEGHLRAAQDAIAQHTQRIAELGLAEPVPERELVTTEERLQAWAEEERELRAEQMEVERARAAFAEALRRCPPGAKPEALLALEPPHSAKLESLLRDGARVEAQRFALKAELDRLPGAAAGPSREQLTQAAGALRAWLREPEARPRGSAWIPWTIVAAAGLAVAALGVWVSPYFFLGVAAVVALGVVQARSARSVPSSRPGFERQYATCGLDAPDWTAAGVEARLAAIESMAVEARASEHARERRKALEQELAGLDIERRAFESTRVELRGALGVDALAADLDLHGFAAAVAALGAAHGEVEASSTALALRERRLAEAKAAAAGELARWTGSRVVSIAEARGVLAELRTRSTELAQALRDRERARTDEGRARGEVDGVRTDTQRFWTELGLDAGSEAELDTRLARFAEWKRLDGDAQRDQLARSSLEQRLGERASEVVQGREVLERRKREAGEAADRAQALNRDLGALQERLRAARAELRRESAAADVARCRAALEEQMRSAYRHRLGSLLLEEVKAEYEQQSQPAVLQRAGRDLELFTHGRYGVRGERDGGVRVIDHDRPGRGLALGELSTGTRAQLFLALRQAFAAEVSRGERVPLVLDDALATSDPDRVRAIGAALATMAGEDGWQVLYLTTDAVDARLLFGDDRKGVDVVDLAALRELQRGTLTSEHFVQQSPAPVPSPEGMTPEAYAELVRVPAIDPFAPAEALHPFHVLREDLPALKRALDARLESAGALSAILAQRPDLLDAPSRSAFRAWLAVARAAIAAWRVGRGDRVDRRVLADPESGVSEAFLDKLAGLAKEVGGDARQLLKCIDDKHPRARGFGEAKREKLRQFLEERGYHDPRDRLEREQAWMSVLTSDLGDWRPPEPALRARFEWLWESLERAERELRA